MVCGEGGLGSVGYMVTSGFTAICKMYTNVAVVVVIMVVVLAVVVIIFIVVLSKY